MDELFDEAVKSLSDKKTVHAGDIQRSLKVGYARAIKILDDLCKEGMITQLPENPPRQVFQENVQKYLTSPTTYKEYQLKEAKRFDKEFPTMVCKAFIIDLFRKRYMLHIWLKPHFSIAWHKKQNGLVGKLFRIEKYS